MLSAEKLADELLLGRGKDCGQEWWRLLFSAHQPYLPSSEKSAQKSTITPPSPSSTSFSIARYQEIKDSTPHKETSCL